MRSQCFRVHMCKKMTLSDQSFMRKGSFRRVELHLLGARHKNAGAATFNIKVGGGKEWLPYSSMAFDGDKDNYRVQRVTMRLMPDARTRDKASIASHVSLLLTKLVSQFLF